MFAPGDEVVCTDSGGCEPFLQTGAHYTVSSTGIVPHDPHVYVRLVGVCENEAPANGWREFRFRPVKRESIAIFREMCTAISSGRTLVRVGE